jgi:hypothetical protein
VRLFFGTTFDSLSLNLKINSMKRLKHLAFLIIGCIVMTSFSQCSSSKKIQSKSPIEFGNVYCETWVAGIEGGGSGINIFIPIKKEIQEGIEFDSVYFRGKVAKLEIKPNDKTLYIGRFKTGFNTMKPDIVMSSDSKEEYGNQLPKIEVKIPFDLKNDECVVSYQYLNKYLYYKIENIIEKQAQHYPSAPPNRQ